MKRIAMAVLVFKVPRGADPKTCEKELYDAFWEGRPADVESLAVLGLSQGEEKALMRGLRSGKLREPTQDVLRRIGGGAERFIQDEPDYQFVWGHESPAEFGPVHVLMVVRISEGVFVPDSGGCTTVDPRHSIGPIPRRCCPN
jgi:hypothetical protein